MNTLLLGFVLLTVAANSHAKIVCEGNFSNEDDCFLKKLRLEVEKPHMNFRISYLFTPGSCPMWPPGPYEGQGRAVRGFGGVLYVNEESESNDQLIGTIDGDVLDSNLGRFPCTEE